MKFRIKKLPCRFLSVRFMDSWISLLAHHFKLAYPHSWRSSVIKIWKTQQQSGISSSQFGLYLKYEIQMWITRPQGKQTLDILLECNNNPLHPLSHCGDLLSACNSASLRKEKIFLFLHLSTFDWKLLAGVPFPIFPSFFSACSYISIRVD